MIVVVTSFADAVDSTGQRDHEPSDPRPVIEDTIELDECIICQIKEEQKKTYLVFELHTEHHIGHIDRTMSRVDFTPPCLLLSFAVVVIHTQRHRYCCCTWPLSSTLLMSFSWKILTPCQFVGQS